MSRDTADLTIPIELRSTPSAAGATLTVTERMHSAERWRGHVERSYDEARDGHRDVIGRKLDDDAQRMATGPESLTEVITHLGTYGFAWTDVARIVGVSVPALRKWRMQKGINSAHAFSLARLVAFAQYLREEGGVDDVVAWLALPIRSGVPISFMDVVAKGGMIDICEYTRSWIAADTILDTWIPGWHDRFRQRFEIVETADGERGIRPLDRKGLPRP